MIKKPPLHFYSLNVTMIYHRETNVEWQHLTVSGIASCMRGDILPQWSTKWSLGTLADDKWPTEGGVSQLTTQIGISASTMSDSVTPWTVAHQAPLSVEFSRQEYWSGLPSPSPGDLPNPGIKRVDSFIRYVKEMVSSLVWLDIWDIWYEWDYESDSRS